MANQAKRKKTITLTINPKLEQWLLQYAAAWRYSRPSEVLREAVRRFWEQEEHHLSPSQREATNQAALN